MASVVAYEVIAPRPVCVDFEDGRVVSFTPGMRFRSHPTNKSVRRLVKVQELRQLSPYEAVPALPIQLGASHRVRNILENRKRLEDKKKVRPAKAVIDLGSLHKPVRNSDEA